MNVWKQLDQMVAKHKAQIAELVELAKEGKCYRKPRFVPPCVWTLRVRAAAPPPHEPLTFTTYEAALTELKWHADNARERKRLRDEAKKAAKAAKKKGGRSR